MTSRPTAKTSRARSADAIKLLARDHKEVNTLFKNYDELCESGAPDHERAELARRICQLLTVHATIEEELLYPAARAKLEKKDADLVDEAAVEHQSAKDLIAQIEAGSPSDELFDAHVTVLGEYVNHHVREEEKQLFPKLKQTDLDLAALGQELAARKQALMSEVSAMA